MNKLIMSLAALVLMCSQASHGFENYRIGDFALLDETGKYHKLSWYGDQKAVVIFIQGNGCPIVRNSAPELRAIRDAYADRGVQVFMLNPQMQDNRGSIAAESADLGFDLSLIHI